MARSSLRSLPSFSSKRLIVHSGKSITLSLSNSKPRMERLENVTDIIFLLNCTKIGDYAFQHAVNLIVVNIPEGVTHISKNSFWGCSKLKSVAFPKSLKNIGAYAFNNCTRLSEVDLRGTGVEVIENEAFYYCEELKSMKIPDSLVEVGRFVFLRCFKLVPEGVDTKDNEAVLEHLRSQQEGGGREGDGA
mmetsp:Transcript_3152/g.5904  ORF Transcript_3152/g.5904 Transcript_3152/m.5904 type:complete len:190 (+) Transcript_3152:346-915(+)|eukprot:CAMPEP_0182493818 /NCGR_PEP_ID=MMETSP1321-20130603/2707_1 /TAXON_ID=91990 /ORGANISM="Bolidomonas sp., Strain RCC1657" /LENGTH=189 /DNA_ID=CAMNT_0024696677 /DNA_START=323 /DNA_END=892 /DNA_ORIENTATION=+